MKILLFLFLSLSFSMAQAWEILSREKIKELLGDFPQKDSLEEKADFDELFRLQMTRTEDECRAAAAQEKVSLTTFFGGSDGPLSEIEIRALDKELRGFRSNLGANSLNAKNFYKRLRPYESNPEIHPCIDKPGLYAYPSGHSATAFAYAKILSAKFPERAETFMIKAQQAAQNRVLSGVHHPSDIRAGKILGEFIAQDFLRDFLPVK